MSKVRSAWSQNIMLVASNYHQIKKKEKEMVDEMQGVMDLSSHP